jgi:molecular chaperone DnaK (HSP70)
MADLEVLDVVAEPVAAALYYQSLSPAAGVRRLFVYDLGGGTFDTTVIRLDGDHVQVVCTDGDKPLGGADWDAAVKGYLLDQFRDEHEDVDPLSDEYGLAHLAVAAETARRELTRQDSYLVPVLLAGQKLNLELTRAKLEELTRRLVKRTLDICERTSQTARLRGITGFDELLLVGGMTKMPAIQAALRDRFGIEPRVFDPDLAVVKGAAIYAASVGRIQVNAGAEVTSVLPRALGVKVLDQSNRSVLTDRSQVKYKILHLLPANSPIPADSGLKDFQSAFYDQRTVRIQVFEQAGSIASERLEDNTWVADGVLELPDRLGRHALQVSLEVTAQGLLRVYGLVAESGQEVNFEVQIGGMTPDQIADGRVNIGLIQIGD